MSTIFLHYQIIVHFCLHPFISISHLFHAAGAVDSGNGGYGIIPTHEDADAPRGATGNHNGEGYMPVPPGGKQIKRPAAPAQAPAAGENLYGVVPTGQDK